MNRKIVKREMAKRDIIEHAIFIAQDNVEAAEKFIAATEAAFRLLAETPGAGALREYLNPSLAGLRMWPIRGFDKHLIFYRETPDALEIVRLLHAARDVEAMFRAKR